MQLVLSEDQELLAKTAADFVKERSPVARVRALRDAGDATGFSRELWREMAGLGWVGIPFPEDVGGAGMGLAELAVVLEQLGRALAGTGSGERGFRAVAAFVQSGARSGRVPCASFASCPRSSPLRSRSRLPSRWRSPCGPTIRRPVIRPATGPRKARSRRATRPRPRGSPTRSPG